MATFNLQELLSSPGMEQAMKELVARINRQTYGRHRGKVRLKGLPQEVG
jgi:hypothetical protein